MADRPRHDDWWLASDGKWYPPHLAPGSGVDEPDAVGPSFPVVSSSFTWTISIALFVTSALLVGASISGFRYASAIQKYSGSLSDLEQDALSPVELSWASWTALALLLLVVTGVMVMGWFHSTSKALDTRGPIGRRWRGMWTVGVWLIPFANLLLPKLMYNEIERIARAPHGDAPIGEEWKTEPRSQLGDLWWLLWIAGVIPSQIIQLIVGDPGGDAGRLAVMVNISAMTYAFFAAAGIALSFLVRRIQQASRI